MGGAFLLLMQLAASYEPPLPPSLDQARLAACSPATLEAAETCLRGALSPADLTIVQDRIPARRFRPGLDMAIERAWHLREPGAPLARSMTALLGLDRPSLAAGMIISDLQVRALDPNGIGLDFKAMREAFRINPPGPEEPHVSETKATQEKTHAN